LPALPALQSLVVNGTTRKPGKGYTGSRQEEVEQEHQRSFCTQVGESKFFLRIEGTESIILSKELRQSMANWKDFLVKKVAVVSHDYNLINRYGHQDLQNISPRSTKYVTAKHVIPYCILFLLGMKIPVPRIAKTFSTVSNSKMAIILEVGNKKSTRKVVEVWLKDERPTPSSRTIFC